MAIIFTIRINYVDAKAVSDADLNICSGWQQTQK